MALWQVSVLRYNHPATKLFFLFFILAIVSVNLIFIDVTQLLFVVFDQLECFQVCNWICSWFFLFVVFIHRGIKDFIRICIFNPTFFSCSSGRFNHFLVVHVQVWFCFPLGHKLVEQSLVIIIVDFGFATIKIFFGLSCRNVFVVQVVIKWQYFKWVRNSLRGILGCERKQIDEFFPKSVYT